MEKLNTFGIGPKIAIVLLPWLATSIYLSSIDISLFEYTAEARNILKIAGILIMVSGFILYLSSARMLLKGLKETRLVTEGPYNLCQNPLYASLLFLVIPGLSLLLNSWLILSTSIVGYFLVKGFIKSEYSELEKFFGEEYRKYRNKTPELFPVSLKK